MVSDPTSVPTIRFQSFAENWEPQHLEYFFTSSRIKGREGLPTLSVTLDRGLVNRDELKRKQETNLTEKEHLLVRDGDIAYNMMRMWQGAFGRATSDGIVSPAYVVLRGKKEVDTRYFEYAFRRARSIYLFWAYSYGLTKDRLRLYANDFSRIPFSAPTLPEQRKIADFLTAVDKRIGLLIQKKALLEDYKKGVMQQLFTQAIRFKDDHGNDFPDWEEKKLGEVGDFKSGVGFSEREQGGKTGTPFYKVSDMNLPGNESVMHSANHYVTETQISSNKYKVISEESLVFAKVGAAIFLERKRVASNFLIDNNMMAFTPSFDISFAKHLFATIRLSKFAQVGALPSYNASDLRTIKASIPHPDEQTRIANFLSSIDRKIESVATQITETQTFKRGLLQQMFI